MRRIFADTSALIALKDAADQNHDKALDCFKSAIEEPSVRFVLTNFVLAEVHAYFCRSPAVALAYLEHLTGHPIFTTLRVGGRDERRALEVLRASRDKTYSYVDATSFAVMERMGLRQAFAFDRHFRQHGRFRIIP